MVVVSGVRGVATCISRVVPAAEEDSFDLARGGSMGKLEEAREALLRALLSLVGCEEGGEQDCVADKLHRMLRRLRSASASSRTAAGGVLPAPRAMASAQGSSEAARLRLDEREEAAAKTMLTLAVLGSKLGRLPDALSHARRARDLLIHASAESWKEREKAREMVLSLEEAVSKATQEHAQAAQ